MKVPCAGVSEIGGFTEVRMDEEGRPKQPQLKTVQINLISVIHSQSTCHSHLLSKITELPLFQPLNSHTST